MSNKNKWQFETQAIRTQTERSQNAEHAAPLYLTSSFVFDNAEQARAMFADEIPGNLYSRFTNPNSDEFVEKMCLLEQADAGVSTATGMAAVSLSLLGLLKAGDHIVAARDLFGSTHQVLTKLLPRFGINHSYVSIDQVEAYEQAIKPETRMILTETPSNPGLKLADISALAELSRSKGLILNVDNTFATPWLQNPLALGADIVTHSATKFIDGQGRVMGGAVLGKQHLLDELRFFARQTGPSLSPFNAWMLSRSLETLAVRMERHCENARQIAEKMNAHSKVKWVRYPGLENHPQYQLAQSQMRAGGALLCFELEGGFEAGKCFLDKLALCSITANLGDTRTIATHPASTTHAKLTDQERANAGISDGMIRLSAGLENVEDILFDLNQAMQ